VVNKTSLMPTTRVQSRVDDVWYEDFTAVHRPCVLYNDVTAIRIEQPHTLSRSLTEFDVERGLARVANECAAAIPIPWFCTRDVLLDNIEEPWYSVVDAARAVLCRIRQSLTTHIHPLSPPSLHHNSAPILQSACEAGR
jgi:hypothetical protein